MTTTRSFAAAAADAAFGHIITADVAQRAGMNHHALLIARRNELTWATVCDEIHTAIIATDDEALWRMGLHDLTSTAVDAGTAAYHTRRANAADYYVRAARIARRNAVTFDAMYSAI
jgi:hypothetical protein